MFIGLNVLMKRAFKFKDPFLLKMLRNISQHDDLDIKMKFVVSARLCALHCFSQYLTVYLHSPLFLFF